MKKIILTLLTFLSLSVFAQDIYIPDRPGYTYNALSVGYHRADVEFSTGFGDPYYFNDNMIYNTLYTRYGLFKHLELRVGVEFATIPNNTKYGLSGLNLGVKLPIIEETKYVPSIAIVAVTFLPKVGSPDYQLDKNAPSINLALQKIFFDKLVVFVNSGIYYDGFNTNIRYNSSLATYFFISPKFGIFAETLCKYSPEMSSNNMWDAGMVYYITDNFQWDLSLGKNYKTENSFINTGISWRFPKK